MSPVNDATSITPAGEPHALNAGEPVQTGEVVTLVEGTTFCLSDRAGDINPGGAHGLFVRDARVLSRWQMHMNRRPLQPLALFGNDAFAEQFVLRRPPLAGHADSTLLVLRERLVGDGLRETIMVENVGAETTVCGISIFVDADFADLFAVKEGRAAGSGAHIVVNGSELWLTSREDLGRQLHISASGDALITPSALNWRAVVPARGRWSAEIVAEPVVADQRLTLGFRRGERIDRSDAARKMRAWRQGSTAIETDDPATAAVLARTESDLGALQMSDPNTGTPFVAAGAPWFMTLFGRDSLLTTWMALPLDVRLAVGTLEVLAATQGKKVDPATEEQPGRILHELRLGPESEQALGGSHYYGSVDATPLFVMLLGEVWRWGAEEDVVRRLLPAADAALGWIEEHGDRDGDGFVEYQRATDHGLANQGWKDSFDSMHFADGTPARAPIALCEVQGYTYAAWSARAELAEAFGDAETEHRCRKRAERLRGAFAERFWLPERGWYAMALDGAKRQVDALSSNAAHVLWTGLAEDEHAETLIRRLSSDDMVSGFGLRTLSGAMESYNPMSYHNGSVWPHDTAIATAGLLRYAHLPGAVELAHRLIDGLLDAATAFGDRLPELFCGFDREHFSPPVPYPSSCSPQAWAAAAPLLLVRAALGLEPHVPKRTLRLSPHLPLRWNRLGLVDLELGQTKVRISAEGERSEVDGLPPDWKLDDGSL
jgi:glycogen debranching enzyme